MPISQYICPAAYTPDSRRLGWLREAIEESVSYIKADPGYATLDDDFRIVQRQHPELMPQQIIDGAVRPPQIYAGSGKSKVADIIATLANIQPLWNHYPAGDPRLTKAADVLNKATWAWWHNTYADLRITEALQWSAVQRTGYIYSKWNPNFYGLGQGDVELCTGGPFSFYPLWLGRDHNIQLAYGGIWVEDVPVTEAWDEWPQFQEYLKPDKDPVSFFGRIWSAMRGGARGGDSLMEGGKEPSTEGQVPTVRIYRMYVRDSSKNLSKNSVPMGYPLDASWSYTVPYAGQRIPTGKMSLATGQDLTRPASDEHRDLYLYPNRRLIIFTERAVLYDGPSKCLHGRLPVVKVTLDPWPWSYLGGSMVRDIATLESNSNKELNAITERAELKHDPPKLAVEGLGKGTQEDTRRILRTPGGVLDLDEKMFYNGDPVRTVLQSPQHYETSQWELESLKMKDGLMDAVLGRDYATALAEARQKPSGDTQEKTLQLKGSRIQQRGRMMEWALTELGSHVTGLILQWYAEEKSYLLQNYQGQGDVPFVFKPGQAVPGQLESQDGLPDFTDTSDKFNRRALRAKYVHQNMRLQIEKDSLLEISSMTRQLQMQLLWKDERFPIDPVTLAETMKLPNFGTLDDTPDMDTMVGRFKKWKMIEAFGGGMLQGLMQQGAMQTSLPPEMMQMFQAFMALVQRMQGGGEEPPAGALPTGGNNGGGGPEGRPHVFTASPTLQDKQDHATIATS